jgi:hypothetical protein
VLTFIQNLEMDDVTAGCLAHSYYGSAV